MDFELSQQAVDAFGENWNFYARSGGEKLANRILGDIHDAIQKLCELPNLGHSRPDLTDKPFKFYRIYQILLVYDPAARPLYIARVYHAAQDVKQRMERNE